MVAQTASAAASLDLFDMERAARQALPHEVWDFIAGGSGDESTLLGNRTAFDEVRLVPRVMRGITHCDTGSEFLGCAVTMPVAIAPMAYQQLVHPEGELALARAARSAGIVFTASMLSSYSVEEIAEVGADTWLQLYWLRDRSRVRELLSRAEDCGCRALVLTVDVPRMGRRLRDMRNSFVLPRTVTAANLKESAAGASGLAAHHQASGVSALMVHTADAFDPALSWANLEWIREQTQLPVIIKGILHPQDAAQAAAASVDAIVVSNHGGRQLDGALASVAALPGVVRAVAGRCPLILDSGVRSGTDVLKALALGASGVFLGRPALWGLAVGGERGAAQVLDLLRAELEHAMMLAGCADMAAARTLTTAMVSGAKVFNELSVEGPAG